MRFKIDWVSLIVGRKFAVFALFYFVLGGIFQVQAPGGLYLERRFNGGLGGGGAYTWRGLFSEFYGILSLYYGARKQQDQRNQSLYRGTTVPTII